MSQYNIVIIGDPNELGLIHLRFCFIQLRSILYFFWNAHLNFKVIEIFK